MEKEILNTLREIEKKWQKIWKEKKIYEAEVDEKKKKFFITVPYPYTSGPLHIGHGRTYTIGDIIARFHRLLGYNVLFPMGFHVSGTPISGIADAIARGDEKVIKLYKEYIKLYVDDDNEVEKIIESFKNPINVAKFFAEKIQKDFESMGYSIDWRRKFHTAEDIYNKFIEWQYYRMRDKGVIKKGEHYVLYCLLHKQPEGEDDIKDGDVNPVKIVEYTAILFKLDDSYLAASTLRPETIYGCTNLWINPNEDYVKVKFKDKYIIISEKAYVKLAHQYDDVELIEKFKGEKLIGKEVEVPLVNRKVLILPAEFVDVDIATGVVYSEPADAPYDYVALTEIKNKAEEIEKKYDIPKEKILSIEPIKIIDVGLEDFHAKKVVEELGIKSQKDKLLEKATQIVYKEQYYKGILLVGKYKGKLIKEVKDLIKEELIKEGHAFIFRETSRKAVCRAGGKIIVAKIKGQWFIDYNIPGWKEKTKKLIDRMVIYPEKYRVYFYNVLEWLDKRPCARLRGLGTKLPWDKRWVIESLSDSTIYMAFYTIAHIIRRENIKAEQLIPEVFDYIFYGMGNVNELEKKTGIKKETLEEMRRSFEYWYGVDHRHSAPSHISNHLIFYLMHHTLLFDEDKWPKAITINELVIREGQKMSKSKGNVIPLLKVPEIYSVDLYRLYVAISAELESVMDWREKEVENLLGILEYLYKLYEKSKNSKSEIEDSILAKSFLARFYERLKEGKELLKEYKIRQAYLKILIENINDIKLLEKILGDKIYSIVKEIIRDWAISLHPVIPHLAQEMYGEELIETKSWPEKKYEFTKDAIDIVKNLLEDIKNISKLIDLNGKTIKIAVANEEKYEIAKKLKEKDVSEVIKEFKEYTKYIPRWKKLLDKFMERELELKLLKEIKPFIEKEFNVKINIVNENEIDEKKRIYCIPGKFAIEVI